MGWLALLGALAAAAIGLVTWIFEPVNDEAHPGRTEEDQPTLDLYIDIPLSFYLTELS